MAAVAAAWPIQKRNIQLMTSASVPSILTSRSPRICVPSCLVMMRLVIIILTQSSSSTTQSRKNQKSAQLKQVFVFQPPSNGGFVPPALRFAHAKAFKIQNSPPSRGAPFFVAVPIS
jgi:hypothetical protein